MFNAAFRDEFQKLAADKKRTPVRDVAKLIGSGLLGFGAGTAAGMGGGYLANEAVKHFTGKEIPREALMAIGPMLGAAGGIAYSTYKAKELEKIHRALKDQADHHSG